MAASRFYRCSTMLSYRGRALYRTGLCRVRPQIMTSSFSAARHFLLQSRTLPDDAYVWSSAFRLSCSRQSVKRLGCLIGGSVYAERRAAPRRRRRPPPALRCVTRRYEAAPQRAVQHARCTASARRRMRLAPVLLPCIRQGTIVVAGETETPFGAARQWSAARLEARALAASFSATACTHTRTGQSLYAALERFGTQLQILHIQHSSSLQQV